MVTDSPAGYWKVRIVLHGALLHLAAWTEPRVTRDSATGRVTAIEAEWIDDGVTGDRLGYLSLPAVTAVAWRRADGLRRVPAEITAGAPGARVGRHRRLRGGASGHLVETSGDGRRR